MQGKSDRRSPGSKLMRPGALQCSTCGTTWFDQLAHAFVDASPPCRRCGGTLHAERRGQRAAAARVA